jgi:hypothetical protein
MTPKFFIGPMSKNIVDTIIDFCNKNNTSIGLIPSRRQVEFNGGYVNNWKTSEFTDYVRSKTNHVLLVRDHSGPGQGQFDDDGYESLTEDCKFFDIIHIDPWKKYPSFNLGLKETIRMIEHCYELNPNLQYEIGTEEAIRRFEPYELEELIIQLKNRLDPNIFDKIKYLVIQSGTSLKQTTQTGEYDKDRLIDMVKVSRKYGLISKEHNGDYLPIDLIKQKFNYGLDSINIAPEFGVIETKVVLDEIIKNSQNDLFEKFYTICYESKKWVKWVDKNFKPEDNKKDLILICGHYVISNEDFISLKKQLDKNIDDKIKNKIEDKLNNMNKVDHVDLLNNYFNLFSNKDINGLREMFSEDVELIDWEIHSNGIENVINSNQNIFNSVETIRVELKNIYENISEKSFCCEILISINDELDLKVIDIIRFNENGKIKQISAYKQ